MYRVTSKQCISLSVSLWVDKGLLTLRINVKRFLLRDLLSKMSVSVFLNSIQTQKNRPDES